MCKTSDKTTKANNTRIVRENNLNNSCPEKLEFHVDQAAMVRILKSRKVTKSANMRSSSKLFQSPGAFITNTKPAVFTKLDFGTTSRALSEDLRLQLGSYRSMETTESFRS